MRLIALIHGVSNDVQLRQVLFSSLTVSHTSSGLLKSVQLPCSWAKPCFLGYGLGISAVSPKREKGLGFLLEEQVVSGVVQHLDAPR